MLQRMALMAATNSQAIDQYFSNVSLLLHMDGANNSTTFVDSSRSPFTVTTGGSAVISTSQSRFGGASGSFPGNGWVQVSSPTSNLLNWWSTDYTLELWARASSFTQHSDPASTLIGNMQPSGTLDYWSFGTVSSGALMFRYYNGSGQSITSASTASLNTWNHLAFTVSATTIRLFLNGVVVGTGSVTGTPQISTSVPLAIGGNRFIRYNGFVDEVRITKGVARYTSNFTPDITAFPDA